MRRLTFLLGAVALAATACGPGEVQVRERERRGFIPQVIDATHAAGAGLSLAMDADGNPHLSYLAFPRPPQRGEPPAVIEPGEPIPPAVMHAHFTEDVWTRTPVAEGLGPSPQEEGGPQAGPTPSPSPTADADGGEPAGPSITEEDETAIAVDADGVHHVAWTQGDRVMYANNAEGDFGDPEVVATGAAVGLSIAAGPDGTPWVAFYEDLTDPEGPASLVRVASRAGDAWAVETAAEAEGGDPRTTGIGVAGQEALVAYGDAGRTMLARAPAGGEDRRWRSETADRRGGLGVSLALDGDGNPHLAYYDDTGRVAHSHSVGGAEWEVSDVAEPQPPKGDWSTSIALDGEGVHHVAWMDGFGIGYTNNAEGDFAEVDEDAVSPDSNAVRPRVGAGPEGIVYVAWQDTRDVRLMVAVRGDEPLLAAPEPEEEEPAPPPGDGGGPPPCEPDGTELQVTAPVGAAVDGFDTECLAAPAGEAFTIRFDNDDQGVPHNVAIYTDDSASESLFVGETFAGPDTREYEVDPIEETGNLFFRCDVHPTTMTGTFVVQ